MAYGFAFSYHSKANFASTPFQISLFWCARSISWEFSKYVMLLSSPLHRTCSVHGCVPLQALQSSHMPRSITPHAAVVPCTKSVPIVVHFDLFTSVEIARIIVQCIVEPSWTSSRSLSHIEPCSFSCLTILAANKKDQEDSCSSNGRLTTTCISNKNHILMHKMFLICHRWVILDVFILQSELPSYVANMMLILREPHFLAL